jgi:hypothetical protein
MQNRILDTLVFTGTLKNYRYENLDMDGNFGKSKHSNSERLVLVFPHGTELVISSYCDLGGENTGLFLELQ